MVLTLLCYKIHSLSLLVTLKLHVFNTGGSFFSSATHRVVVKMLVFNILSALSCFYLGSALCFASSHLFSLRLCVELKVSLDSNRCQGVATLWAQCVCVCVCLWGDCSFFSLQRKLRQHHRNIRCLSGCFY